MKIKRIIASAMALAISFTPVSAAQSVCFETISAMADDTAGSATFDEESGTITISGAVSADDLKAYARNYKVMALVAEEGTVLPENCTELFKKILAKNIDLSKADTSNVTCMKGMFLDCERAVSIDTSSFDTSKVTDMSSMFEGCSRATKLNLSSFDTSGVTNMKGMFQDMNDLEEIDVSNFDTSNVTNMSHMFYSLQEVKTLDLGNFNTSKVTDMSNMFNYLRHIENLNISSFDTSNVENMSYMFWNNSGLTSVDVSNFNTSKVKDFSFMFANSGKIESLDLSSFETSKVRGALVGMAGMFESCHSLKEVDLSSFDTSSVFSMSDMFQYCTSLETLDLRSFDTSKAGVLAGMFCGCEKLKTIIVSDKWTTKEVYNSDNMFKYCAALVGGNGTVYDETKTDKEYARIDAPDAPGYLTAGEEIPVTTITSVTTSATTTTSTVTVPSTTTATSTEAPSTTTTSSTTAPVEHAARFVGNWGLKDGTVNAPYGITAINATLNADGTGSVSVMYKDGDSRSQSMQWENRGDEVTVSVFSAKYQALYNSQNDNGVASVDGTELTFVRMSSQVTTSSSATTQTTTTTTVTTTTSTTTSTTTETTSVSSTTTISDEKLIGTWSEKTPHNPGNLPIVFKFNEDGTARISWKNDPSGFYVPITWHTEDDVLKYHEEVEDGSDASYFISFSDDALVLKKTKDGDASYVLYKEALSLGDVNNDGKVDAKDASLILVEYASLSTDGKSVLSDEAKTAADVNKDGKADSKDASAVLQYYAYTSTGGTDSIEKYLG